jgi:FtsP/CotA-like multicopper oxidase with cupredoxin domain
MAITVIRRKEVPAGEEAHFHKHVCPPRFRGGPLDPQFPTRVLRRDLDVQIDLPLPPEVAARTRAGKNDIRLWIIEDPDDPNGRTFPSPIIRTVRGDIVHVSTGFKLNDHTIHWHGIEPSSMNDGVGKHSFEATSRFVYQFATSTAGTFFYHCHKNTVTHFEMGLYGLLVVDPPNPNPDDPLQAPYATGGPGLVAANLAGFSGFPGFDGQNMVVPYDVEALWVLDEMDSVWHDLQHDAFMQRCDPDDPANPANFSQDGILNDFRPDIFLITGVVSVPTTPAGVFPEEGAPIAEPQVASTAHFGDTVLIRLLNAGYTIQECTLGADAIAIASDGEPFGVPPSNAYSSAFMIPAGAPFRLTSARRVDLLVRATQMGEIPFAAEIFDWVKGPDSPNPKLFHILRTAIRVMERNEARVTGGRAGTWA